MRRPTSAFSILKLLLASG